MSNLNENLSTSSSLSKDSVWLYRISASLLHPIKGQESCAVSVPCNFSKNGFMSIYVDNKQIFAYKNKKGEYNCNFVNIRLGEGGERRTAAINSADGIYPKLMLTNAEILESKLAADASFREQNLARAEEKAYEYERRKPRPMQEES